MHECSVCYAQFTQASLVPVSILAGLTPGDDTLDEEGFPMSFRDHVGNVDYGAPPSYSSDDEDDQAFPRRSPRLLAAASSAPGSITSATPVGVEATMPLLSGGGRRRPSRKLTM